MVTEERLVALDHRQPRATTPILGMCFLGMAVTTLPFIPRRQLHSHRQSLLLGGLKSHCGLISKMIAGPDLLSIYRIYHQDRRHPCPPTCNSVEMCGLRVLQTGPLVVYP